MNPQSVIEETCRWVQSIVIGLNLCPFARKVFQEDRIRYVVTDANNSESLLVALESELSTLAGESISRVETTLLIHPLALTNFLDYNDFLGAGDDLINQRGLSGVIQLASFHPEYQFANSSRDAVENYTNRSPYPMLHLLREASIQKVADDPEMLADIPRHNIETLKAIGLAKLLKMLKPPAN